MVCAQHITDAVSANALWEPAVAARMVPSHAQRPRGRRAPRCRRADSDSQFSLALSFSHHLPPRGAEPAHLQGIGAAERCIERIEPADWVETLV